MTVLDTLLIVFEGDASKVKKGTKEAEKGLRDVENAAHRTDLVAHKVGESFMDLAKETAGALAGLYAAHHVFEGIMHAGEQVEVLGNLSESLGISIEDLGLWGDAVDAVDGDIGAFHESVKSLSAAFAMFEATGGGRTAKFFQALGINMLDAHGKARGVLDVLPELNRKFQEMSKQESFGFGKKMGLDDGLIRLLQRTPKEFEEIVKKQKALGQATQEDAEQYAKFDEATKELNHATRQLYLGIGSFLFPIMGEFIGLIISGSEFLQEHKGVLYGIGIAITIALLPALAAGAVAIGAFIVAFGPIIAVVGAVIAAIALAGDEIVNWVEGNDSYLTRMLGTWDEFSGKIMGYVNKFKGWIGDLVDAYEKFESKISGIFSSKEHTASVNAYWKEHGGMGALGNDAASQINAANNNPLNGAATGTISSLAGNKTNQFNVEKIEVNTQATDADGISKHIGDSMNDQFSQTAYGFDNGWAI